MNNKINKILNWIIGIIYFVALFLYLILGYEWAREPFFLVMAVICLWNLFYNKQVK